jgi:hypothetical protein
MEGSLLAEDGTLKEFCRIIRSQRVGDPLAIKVFRASTGELLEGQFNGRTMVVKSKVDAVAQQEQQDSPVGTGDASLEIVNESETSIAGLNIASIDSTQWGGNVLGDVTIDTGTSHKVSGITAGTYDVRALDADGKSLGSIYNVLLEGDQTWSVVGLANLPADAKVTYEDDFSDPSKWSPNSDEMADYAIQDGAYQITVKPENRLAWETYQEFTTSAGFAAEVNCAVDKVGGLCGLGLATDNDDLLWLQVNPSKQEYSLQHLEAGEWQPNLIDYTKSVYIAPNLSNSIALSRSGKLISIYLNGTLVGTVESTVVPSGSVIFGGGTIADVTDVVVSLDSLTVWQVQ